MIHDGRWLEVETPEGVVFSLPLAGPVARFLAWQIDLAAIAAVATAIAYLTRWAWDLLPDTVAAVNYVAIFVVAAGYHMLLEWRWRGATIGKRALRLRVVDRRGLRLSPVQVVLRNLLRPVDQLPLFNLVGGVAMGLSRHAQRLGDLGANTVVVRVAPVPLPPVEHLTPPRYNSLRDRPHIEARLRRAVPPAAAVLAVRALLRRDEMDAAARVELFREMAAALRQWGALPPELTAGRSDEQIVRNVVDSYFRAPS